MEELEKMLEQARENSPDLNPQLAPVFAILKGMKISTLEAMIERRNEETRR